MSSRDIDQQAEHLAAIVAEKLEDQLAQVVENIDSRIERQFTPLKIDSGIMKADIKTLALALKDTSQDLKTLKEDNRADTKVLQAVQKDTNQYLKSLDTAIGNVEHRVDGLNTLVTNHYLGGVWSDRKLLHDLDERVEQLEKTNA